MSNSITTPQRSSSPVQNTSVNQLLGMVTQALYHHSIRIRRVMKHEELEKSVFALNLTVKEYLDQKQRIESMPSEVTPVQPPLWNQRTAEDEGVPQAVQADLAVRADLGVRPSSAVSLPLEETPFFKEQTRRMADIGTGLWRLRLKMVQPGTDQPLEEFRKTYRHLQSVWDVLQEAGYSIQDHTGQPFDIGMDLKVITYEQKAGLQREIISETIKPSIYYQREGKTLLLQMGEVIVATPENEELLKP